MELGKFIVSQIKKYQDLPYNLAKPRVSHSTRSYYACLAVTALSAATSAGFSIAAAFNGTDHINALYTLVRSLSLVLIVALIYVRKSPVGLAVMAIIITLVQLGDAVVGYVKHDALTTYGPLGLALLTIAFSAVHVRNVVVAKDL